MPEPAIDRVRTLLSDAEFPAGRNDLVKHVETRGRPGDEEDAIHTVLVLPEGTYVDLDEVLAAIGHNAERAPGPTSGPDDVVADDD